VFVDDRMEIVFSLHCCDLLVHSHNKTSLVSFGGRCKSVTAMESVEIKRVFVSDVEGSPALFLNSTGLLN